MKIDNALQILDYGMLYLILNEGIIKMKKADSRSMHMHHSSVIV